MAMCAIAISAAEAAATPPSLRVPFPIRVAFPAGVGLRVHDGAGMRSGGVLRSGVGAFLNLHRPGTVRSLLEEALAAGHGAVRAAPQCSVRPGDRINGVHRIAVFVMT